MVVFIFICAIFIAVVIYRKELDMFKKFTVFAVAAICAVSSLSGAELNSFPEVQKAGMAAYNAKEYDKACEIFKAWTPKAATGYQKWFCFFWQTKSLRNLKKYDDALKVCDAYIKSDPVVQDKAGANFICALIYVSKNESGKAVPFLEEAINCPEFKTKYAEMHRQACDTLVAQLYFLRNYDKCVAAADKVIPAIPAELQEQAKVYRALALFDLKKFSESEKAVKELLPTLKNNYNKHMISYIYGQILLKADNEDEAVKYLQETIKLNPKGWRSNAAKKLLLDLE